MTTEREAERMAQAGTVTVKLDLDTTEAVEKLDTLVDLVADRVLDKMRQREAQRARTD